jgi:serine/threonine-protein kinase
VYLAHDRRLGRKVAVKLLHAALANDPVFLRRFQSEAKSAAALSSPYIMAVYDWGESGGVPYLVLELLAGGSLREHFARGVKFSLEQVVLMGQQGASGLAYAHQRHYVHRDIKPANLLFDDDGRLRIADFGLAKALSAAAMTEPEGVLLGTARYASPEQGLKREVTARSDIYSLGLVMYECLTGNIPFEGESPLELLMARVGVRVQAPEQAGVLGPLLERCLSEKVSDRPVAQELVSELELLARRLDPPRPIQPIQSGPYLELPGAGGRDGIDLTQILPSKAEESTGVFDIDSFAPMGVGARSTEFAPMGAQDLTATIFDDERATVAISHLADETSLVGSPPSGGNGTLPPVTPAPKRSGRGRKIGLWSLLIVLLAVLGFGGGLVYEKLTRATVPSFLNLDLAQARALASKDQLDVTVSNQVYSATVPSGRVVLSTPRSGIVVRKHSTVDLVLSRGHAPVTIPAVQNSPSASAVKRLKDLGFKVTTQQSYSENVASGNVITLAPAPGYLEPFGSSVSLTISKGPAPRPVPNLVGDTEAQAKAALSTLQLVAAETLAYSNTVPQGQVISQATAPQTLVLRGSTVNFVLSQGPHYVQVPNVASDTLAQAKAALSAVGLVADPQPVVPGANTVAYFTPAASTQVLYGSTVTLYLIP